MAKKRNAIEKAIEGLEGEKAVLDLAIQKLRAQLLVTAAKPRKAKASRPVAFQEASAPRA